jgi:hypothetical protein
MQTAIQVKMAPNQRTRLGMDLERMQVKDMGLGDGTGWGEFSWHHYRRLIVKGSDRCKTCILQGDSDSGSDSEGWRHVVCEREAYRKSGGGRGEGAEFPGKGMHYMGSQGPVPPPSPKDLTADLLATFDSWLSL